jgi:alpha-amylase/alpha-mannosidase (GH57 family)
VSEPVRFLLGVHNHQPSGNFDSVILAAARQAYEPFLEAVRDAPGVVLTVHCSGGLLAFLRERARPTFDLLGGLVGEGRRSTTRTSLWPDSSRGRSAATT